MKRAKQVITELKTCIALPVNYLYNDILAFHQRDKEAIAERVTNRTIEKGLIWSAKPARLTITFSKQQANVHLLVDGKVEQNNSLLESTVKRMLGLTQPIEVFEQTYKQHPLLAPLINSNKGLRVPMTATPFEAVTWAIIGQQISVSAAVAIRRRLIQLASVTHSSGLLCYPDAKIFYNISLQELRQAGLSIGKANTFHNLSERIIEGILPLDEWSLNSSMASEHITKELLAIAGIGPWTVSYALLRGFGYLDGSLHGDVAVRRNLQYLLKSKDKLTADFTEQWLTQFKPWRALVAAHLWKIDSTALY